MKQKKKSAESGAYWMDTYGDMVTLLLCFFVLLYSVSTVDQAKFENLVESLNPNAMEPSQIVTVDVTNGEGEVVGTTETTAEIDRNFNEIYNDLIQMKEDNYHDMSDVQIVRGDGYHFITFNDSVFFDGNSSILREGGMEVLDGLAEVIASASDSIKELQVLGHTSQGHPTIPNEVMTDRVLSATRAAVVVAYIQEKDVIDPEKLVSTAYGQFRPIATFDTPEGRAMNRRVEVLITKTGSVERTLEEYYTKVYADILEGQS